MRGPIARAPFRALPFGLLLAAVVQLPSCIVARNSSAAAATPVSVFSRHMTGTYLVVGDEQRRISFIHGHYIAPRLLPGLEHVVVNSRRDGGPGIWLEEVDGDGTQEVCSGDQVSVSPDGGALALRRDGAIIVRNLASGDERVVSPIGPETWAHPSYLSDGRVLFVSAEGGLFISAADAEPPASPTPLVDAEIAGAPRCSPDGATVAYQHGPHLYLADLESGRARRLTTAGGIQSWPMWSRDGRSVVYLQSPSPVDGPKHLYRVPVDAPDEATLVVRDVQDGPDWNGVGLEQGARAPVPGQDVRIRHAVGSMALPADGAIPSPGPDWEELPVAGPAATGDVLVECPWGGLYASASTGRILMARRQGEELIRSAELALLDVENQAAPRIAAAETQAITADAVCIELTLSLSDGSSADALLLLSRSAPLVTMRPGDGIAGLRVRRQLDLAVVPDRLAHDLVYTPAGCQAPSVELPRAPLVLGRPADGDGMIVVSAPHEAQTVALTAGEAGRPFAGLRVAASQREVAVAFLPGEDLWGAAPVTPAEEGDGWSVGWSNPFPAQWRLAAQGERASASMMVRMDTPIRGKPRPLEDSEGMTGLPDSAVIYAYGRSQNTPLNRAMPLDVLWEMLGTGAAAEAMDIEGVRGYREADDPAPYVDPRVALKVVRWIHGRERAGARQKIDAVCRGILASLTGLDKRATEYERAFEQLQQTCAAPAADGLGDRLDGGLHDAQGLLRGRPVPDLDALDRKMGAFRRDPGADYTPFASGVTGALTPRLVRLRAYRALARALRHEAGQLLAREPESREVCEQVRGTAASVLRNRCYLEGGWAGEEPIGGPEVSYDEIEDW